MQRSSIISTRQCARRLNSFVRSFFLNRTLHGKHTAHIIPRTPTFTSFGDSCLEGAGGYCISLDFWWHIPFPEAVIQRNLKHKEDNKDGLLISINVLEFVTVIINYCAALHFVTTTLATDDPYPVLLNVTDNTSALSWTTGSCKKSKVGHLLAQFFCSLMINSPLGINSKWISTDDNKIADNISCIKRESATEDSPPFLIIQPSHRCTRS